MAESLQRSVAERLAPRTRSRPWVESSKSIGRWSPSSSRACAPGRKSISGAWILKGRSSAATAPALGAGLRPTESLRPGNRSPPLDVRYPWSSVQDCGRIFDGVRRPLLNSLGSEETRSSRSPRSAARPLSLVALKPARSRRRRRDRSGDMLGGVQETQAVIHASWRHQVSTVDPGRRSRERKHVDGAVARIESKQGTVHELYLFHRWPVRTASLPPRDEGLAPLLTGQRILDTFFPLVKGGRRPSPVRSARARPWCSNRSRGGPTPTS